MSDPTPSQVREPVERLRHVLGQEQVIANQLATTSDPRTRQELQRKEAEWKVAFKQATEKACGQALRNPICRAIMEPIDEALEPEQYFDPAFSSMWRKILESPAILRMLEDAANLRMLEDWET